MDTISGRDFAAGKLQKVMKIFFILPLSLFLVFHLSRNVSFFFSRSTQTICVFLKRFSPSLIFFTSYHIYKIPLGNEKREGEGGEKEIQTIFLIADAKLYKHECTQESS